MTAETSSQLDDDVLEAWSSAINLQLYDDDPGPRDVELAGGLEAGTVDRWDALIDLYGRSLLAALGGDSARLDAVEAECRRQGKAESTLAASVRIALRRLRPPWQWSSWLSCFEACTRRDRWGRRDAWLIAAELATHARRMVAEAGAEADIAAKDKLLTATEYSLNRDILGDFLPPEFLTEQAEDLVEHLNEGDSDPGSDPGGFRP